MAPHKWLLHLETRDSLYSNSSRGLAARHCLWGRALVASCHVALAANCTALSRTVFLRSHNHKHKLQHNSQARLLPVPRHCSLIPVQGSRPPSPARPSHTSKDNGQLAVCRRQLARTEPRLELGSLSHRQQQLLLDPKTSGTTSCQGSTRQHNSEARAAQD